MSVLDIFGDLVKRGVLVVTGNMNYDIVQQGPRIHTMAELKVGDVLLKQGTWSEGATAVIGIGQTLTNRSDHKYLGAGLLGHAAIYDGDGHILEAVGSGVTRRALGDGYNKDFNWYVIRCKEAAVGEAAAQFGRIAVGRVSYNGVGLVGATIVGTGGLLGSVANAAERDISDPTHRDLAKLRNGEAVQMYCSEFVVFCLNCATDTHGRGRFLSYNQDKGTPEELYVTLRDHHDWEYVGELHKGER